MAIKIQKASGGEERLVCLVPLEAINKWFSWMNRAAPIADEISGYCIKFSS